MKIALLAHNLRFGGGVMVGKGLIESMVNVAPDHQYLVTVPEGLGYPLFSDQEHVQVLQSSFPTLLKRFLWERRTLGKQLRSFQPDWVWSLGNIPWPEKRYRQSLLIHDPHLFMDESLFQNTSFLSRQKKHIVRSKLRKGQSLIDRFYAQTPVIVRHLCDTYGIAPERFSLCPPGVELHREKLDHARNDFISQHTGQDIMGRFCLFYPARCYDHKNHASIIRAYQEHRDQLKNTCCIFTIDAETNPIAKERMSEVHALGLSEQIINIGPIDHSMVMKWFEAADALLMPTTMETFGIPFLEAMVTETPVIASDRDFSRAVCGDAALYVDPLDPQDICEAIVRLQDDPTLREELQTKGTVQAQQYKSWDGVIRDVLRNESIPCIPDS